MKYYACCWRFDNMRAQFTILKHDQPLTREFMLEERGRMFAPNDSPWKVQVMELTESEGKTFDDMTDEELRERQPNQEFIEEFQARYEIKKLRFIFDYSKEMEQFIKYRNQSRWS